MKREKTKEQLEKEVEEWKELFELMKNERDYYEDMLMEIAKRNIVAMKKSGKEVNLNDFNSN